MGDKAGASYPVPPLAKFTSFEAALSLSEAALIRLEKLGRSVRSLVPDCWLCDLLRRANPPEAPERDLERLSFALLEMSEIIEIVGLVKHPSPRGVYLLRRMIKGGLHPDDETTTIARETVGGTSLDQYFVLADKCSMQPFQQMQHS